MSLTIIETLHKARAILEAQPFIADHTFVMLRNPTATKNTSYSQLVTNHKPEELCFCTIGAIGYAAGYTEPGAWGKHLPLFKTFLAPNGFTDETDAYDFNDKATKEEILALFDKALEALEA